MGQSYAPLRKASDNRSASMHAHYGACGLTSSELCGREGIPARRVRTHCRGGTVVVSWLPHRAPQETAERLSAALSVTEAIVLLQMVASDTGPTITGVDKDNLQQYLNELFQAVLKVPELGCHYRAAACVPFLSLWLCIALKVALC